MATTGKYLTAKYGNTTIAGVHAWRVTEDADRVDEQVGAHQGKKADGIGSTGLNADIELKQDIATGIYTAVRAGTTLTDLKLYRDASDTTPAFEIPKFNVFNSDNGATVKDQFTVKFSGSAYGDYTANDPS